jgi:hypothetical protein
LTVTVDIGSLYVNSSAVVSHRHDDHDEKQERIA